MTDTIFLETADFLHLLTENCEVNEKEKLSKSFLLLMKEDVGVGEMTEEAMFICYKRLCLLFFFQFGLVCSVGIKI